MIPEGVELPPRIAALPRDRRGYPIPFIVLRDADGNPEFTVNDTALLWRAIRENLCHVCGQALDDRPWFIGGPGAALLNGDRGVYRDGPLHHECMRFAARVCPHLIHHLAKPVALDPIVARLGEQGIRAVNNTVIPGVPDIFVAVQGFRYEVTVGPYFQVPKPFRKVEYWRYGALEDKREGERIAKRAARELDAQLRKA